MKPSRSPVGRTAERRSDQPHAPFWILTGFLVLTFLTGGSARENAPLLFVLRPVAILIAAYGFATLPPNGWRAHSYPLALTGAVVLLTLCHLIPLPAVIWHGLPAHDLVRTIDAAAGLGSPWRPLSLAPGRTINALFSLSVPLATLTIGMQLTAEDRIRILYVLLGLATVSAILGLFQSAGALVNFYVVRTANSAADAPGLFANQNHQAALLSTMLPMLAVTVRCNPRRSASRWLKPLAAASGIALVMLLIATGSRAGLALGVIAIAFTLFYGLLQIDLLDRLPPRLAIGIKLAAGMAVIGMAALATILTARDVAFSRLAMLNADLRPHWWASILRILPDYQPWGSGIGSYVEVYRTREPMALLRETFSNHAHNEYLEVLMTAGVPGALLLAAAAFLLVRALWRSRHGSEPPMLLARLGVTMIVIMACASLTDYPLRTPLLSSVFALAVLWCGGSGQLPRRRDSAPADISSA